MSTVYRQVADDLRRQIESGELAPGAQLPPRHELIRIYGAGEGTIRRALAVLTNAGLIVGKPPLGTFVRTRRHMLYRPQAESKRPTSEVMDRFMAAITEEGRTPSQTIEVSLVRPPREVAERLQVPTDSTVVVRRRIRSIDGEPFNLNDSYFPGDIARGTEIETPSDVARGMNQVLVELGYAQVRAIDEIEARVPTPAEAVRLGMMGDTPALAVRHMCTGYTAEDRPVRCVVNVLVPDRHVILYERSLKIDG